MKISLPAGPRRSTFLHLAALLVLVSCGGGDATAPAQDQDPPRPAGIVLDPTRLEFSALGETASLDAAVVDQFGSPMPSAQVSWSSSDEAVATVSGSGVVTAEGVGDADIRASSGSASATVSVTVTQEPAAVVVEPPELAFEALGQTATLSAEVRDANDNPIPDAQTSWGSSDPAVANVTDEGVVTAVEEGSARITASHQDLTAQVSVTVGQVPARIVLSEASLEFDALEATVTVEARVEDAGGNLVDDAEVEWSSTDGAVASVTAQGAVRSEGPGGATVVASSGELTAELPVTVEQALSAMAFVSSPQGGTTRGMGAPVEVEAVDRLGHRLVGAGQPTMTLSLASNDPGGRLVGETERQAVEGLAAFDDLRLDRIGGGYALAASVEDVTTTSADFSVEIPVCGSARGPRPVPVAAAGDYIEDDAAVPDLPGSVIQVDGEDALDIGGGRRPALDRGRLQRRRSAGPGLFVVHLASGGDRAALQVRHEPGRRHLRSPHQRRGLSLPPDVRPSQRRGGG